MLLAFTDCTFNAANFLTHPQISHRRCGGALTAAACFVALLDVNARSDFLPPQEVFFPFIIDVPWRAALKADVGFR